MTVYRSHAEPFTCLWKQTILTLNWNIFQSWKVRKSLFLRYISLLCVNNHDNLLSESGHYLEHSTVGHVKTYIRFNVRNTWIPHQFMHQIHLLDGFRRSSENVLRLHMLNTEIWTVSEDLKPSKIIGGSKGAVSPMVQNFPNFMHFLGGKCEKCVCWGP